jgi:hypothetical protein
MVQAVQAILRRPTCAVAPSGDRKTPGLNVTLHALDLIEKDNSAAINLARLAHETRVRVGAAEAGWAPDFRQVYRIDVARPRAAAAAPQNVQNL